jgi:hypothetical protein
MRLRSMWKNAHQAVEAAGQLRLLDSAPQAARLEDADSRTAMRARLIESGRRAAIRVALTDAGRRLPDPAPGPAVPEKGPPMTTAMDLSGTWSVAAFHRACEDAHVDLGAFHSAWLHAWLTRLDLGHRHACLDIAHRHEAYGPLCTAREASPPLTACLPLPPACGAALTACGALPPRWPEGAAQRLLVAMVKANEFLAPPPTTSPGAPSRSGTPSSPTRRGASSTTTASTISATG